MEAEALAGLKADIPDPHALVFRQQPLADAAIGILLLPLEFGADLGRPRRPCRGDRLSCPAWFMDMVLLAALVP